MNFSANLLEYTEESRHRTETTGWVMSFVQGQGFGVLEVDEVTVDFMADFKWQTQESRVFLRS